MNSALIPPYTNQIHTKIIHYQWRNAGRGWLGVQTPPKFRSVDKSEPNSQFRGKYIRQYTIPFLADIFLPSDTLKYTKQYFFAFCFILE
jgi:hypothetical protein